MALVNPVDEDPISTAASQLSSPAYSSVQQHSSPHPASTLSAHGPTVTAPSVIPSPRLATPMFNGVTSPIIPQSPHTPVPGQSSAIPVMKFAVSMHTLPVSAGRMNSNTPMSQPHCQDSSNISQAVTPKLPLNNVPLSPVVSVSEPSFVSKYQDIQPLSTQTPLLSQQTSTSLKLDNSNGRPTTNRVFQEDDDYDAL
jgi:hypothetical protein